MSYDIALRVPDDSPEGRVIDAVVRRDNVSPAEAVLSVLRSAGEGVADAASVTRQPGVRAGSRGTASSPCLSDEESRLLGSMGKTFGLLSDVPEEVIDRMSATIERMKRKGFRKIA